jgi:uncharacterized protein (DUF2132 family)
MALTVVLAIGTPDLGSIQKHIAVQCYVQHPSVALSVLAPQGTQGKQQHQNSTLVDTTEKPNTLKYQEYYLLQALRGCVHGGNTKVERLDFVSLPHTLSKIPIVS